ncbi:ABC transporter ATP-binding protein [Aestuariimicrobium sp. T2.26MG-19.2B]|uniref:ABC transporter ATP-binding protein n=1 Tax=Aestuariimicrobium sp. T2.26MG-19.2B TaxID=3040679 RepID=UPI0024778586|nr:ABC transporter ATP-binding protein [Aestuariimicrobium sp. T2.26MG-19.2B]CAI9406756.1 Oligopeptide transport ATP-binding protein OppF [Aestuariimicrobium sp. T2.26MG-19.2B]
MSQTTTDQPVVLEARNVTKHFEVRSKEGVRVVRAVEGVDLQLHRGEIVAMVGESGSGKTTVARMLSLYYPVTEGEILLHGKPVTKVSGGAAKDYYAQVQLLFQDPFASLNSLKSIRHILSRAVRIHSPRLGREAVEEKVLALLDKVALTPASQYIDKFPHELSGGQRQRIVIARALAVEPSVMLGDEPISMLDVSIRLDVLNLLTHLRDEEGVALLYITHDIASARYIADRINVMYAGEMVEGGPSESVIHTPQHPYTRLLLDSSPNPDRGIDSDQGSLFDEVGDLGEPPSLIEPPAGCRFNPRCPFAMQICTTDKPERTEVTPGHWARCHLHTVGGAEQLLQPSIQFGIPVEHVEAQLDQALPFESSTPDTLGDRPDGAETQTVVAESESTSQFGGPQP